MKKTCAGFIFLNDKCLSVTLHLQLLMQPFDPAMQKTTMLTSLCQNVCFNSIGRKRMVIRTGYECRFYALVIHDELMFFSMRKLRQNTIQTADRRPCCTQLVYVCLDTCCSHFLTIIAGVDVHFRHESELPACRTLGLNPGCRGARRGC